MQWARAEPPPSAEALEPEEALQLVPDRQAEKHEQEDECGERDIEADVRAARPPAPLDACAPPRPVDAIRVLDRTGVGGWFLRLRR